MGKSIENSENKETKRSTISFWLSVLAIVFTALTFTQDIVRNWSKITPEYTFRYDSVHLKLQDKIGVIPEFSNGGIFFKIKVLNTGNNDVGYSNIKLSFVDQDGNKHKLDTFEPKESQFDALIFNYTESDTYDNTKSTLMVSPKELSDGTGIIKASSWTDIGMVAYGYKKFNQYKDKEPEVVPLEKGKTKFILEFEVVPHKNTLFDIFKSGKYTHEFIEVVK